MARCLNGEPGTHMFVVADPEQIPYRITVERIVVWQYGDVATTEFVPTPDGSGEPAHTDHLHPEQRHDLTS